MVEPEEEGGMCGTSKSRSILVKRYAANRLYDTTNRRYVSVEQLREWQGKGVAFSVTEAESGENIALILGLKGQP
jgi:polyhydroxyalkanoate synthesis regulator protein